MHVLLTHLHTEEQNVLTKDILNSKVFDSHRLQLYLLWDEEVYIEPMCQLNMEECSDGILLVFIWYIQYKSAAIRMKYQCFYGQQAKEIGVRSTSTQSPTCRGRPIYEGVFCNRDPSKILNTDDLQN